MSIALKEDLLSELRRTFHHKNELLLPDPELYPKDFNSKNIVRAGKKICMWLGIKPTDISFTCDQSSKSSLLIYDGKYHINISGIYSRQPVIGAALLTRYCLAYALMKKKMPPNSEMIEIASIELGLGIMLANAINSGSNPATVLTRIFNVKRLDVDSDVLSYYSPQEYLRLVNIYTSSSDLESSVIASHIMPWLRKYLKSDQLARRIKFEPYVLVSAKQLREQRLKLGGTFILLILVGTFATMLFIKQPRRLTAALQDQKDTIEVLEIAYSKCDASLRQKQKSYDMNDIFMVRQLDAHASRCTSLRNNHDHNVREFNQKLTEQGYLAN